MKTQSQILAMLASALVAEAGWEADAAQLTDLLNSVMKRQDETAGKLESVRREINQLRRDLAQLKIDTEKQAMEEARLYPTQREEEGKYYVP